MALPQPFIDLVADEVFAEALNIADFQPIADALNVRDQRGPVPIAELSAYCARTGITGAIMALLEIPIGTNIVEGVPMTLQIKGLLHTVMTLVQLDYRLETADIDDPATDAGLDGLMALGIVSSDQRAVIEGMGNNRLSKAEIALGRLCTAADVGACR